jgi:hypothetical protein
VPIIYLSVSSLGRKGLMDGEIGGWRGRGRRTAAISFTSKARCWLKYVFWFWGRRWDSVVAGGGALPFWRVVEVDIWAFEG